MRSMVPARRVIGVPDGSTYCERLPARRRRIPGSSSLECDEVCQLVGAPTRASLPRWRHARTRVGSVPAVVLAELEVFHNRPFSPTRRIALGRRDLPVDPPPGFGAVLLGGIAAVAAEELDGEDRDGLRRLIHHLEHGHRVPAAPAAPPLPGPTPTASAAPTPCSAATARRSSSTSTATARRSS